jgi:hypothetical protein
MNGLREWLEAKSAEIRTRMTDVERAQADESFNLALRRLARKPSN